MVAPKNGASCSLILYIKNGWDWGVPSNSFWLGLGFQPRLCMMSPWPIPYEYGTTCHPSVLSLPPRKLGRGDHSEATRESSRKSPMPYAPGEKSSLGREIGSNSNTLVLALTKTKQQTESRQVDSCLDSEQLNRPARGPPNQPTTATAYPPRMAW